MAERLLDSHLYLAKQRFAEAREAFEQMFVETPREARNPMILGMSCLAQGQRLLERPGDVR